MKWLTILLLTATIYGAMAQTRSKEDIERDRKAAIAKFLKESDDETKLKEKKDADRKEANRKVGLRNDSIKLATEKEHQRQRITQDSIDIVEEKREAAANRKAAISSEKAREERIEDEKIKAKQRKQSIIAKYGQEDGLLILDHAVKLGWTKAMCLEAWGKPNDINRTITAGLISEQWVYPSKKLLYFDNDKLTAIQD